jgi:predicted ATP-dependent serine protease
MTVTTVESYYCLYCGYNMTKTGFCIDCNEYKSAVTLVEFGRMNGTWPIYKGKSA